MKIRNWASCIFVLAAMFGYQQSVRPQAQSSKTSVTSAASAAATQRALLNEYCVTCHNQNLKTGGLSLDTADVAHVGNDPAMWEKVVRKLRAGLMPPPGRKRPDASSYEALT